MSNVDGPQWEQSLGKIIAHSPPMQGGGRYWWNITDGSFWSTQQGYLEDDDEHRGKGSFPAMITPAYQNAKKAHELASDVSTTLGPPADPQKQRRSETEGCAYWNLHTDTFIRAEPK